MINFFGINKNFKKIQTILIKTKLLSDKIINFDHSEFDKINPIFNS